MAPGPRKPADSPDSSSLERRLDRLESIVAALDRDDLELDQALLLFEEGIGHLRAAQEILKQAELRVERLTDEGTLGPNAPETSEE